MIHITNDNINKIYEPLNNHQEKKNHIFNALKYPLKYSILRREEK